MSDDQRISMYDCARRGLGEHADKPAVVFMSCRISYGELFRRIDALADALSGRIAVGDAVTLCMPNSPSALIAFYALNRLGATVNLVHPYLPAAQLESSIRETGSKLLVAYDRYLDREPGRAFGVPVLRSDCGWFMGGAAKLFYRLSRAGRKKYRADTLEKYMRPGKFPAAPPRAFPDGQPAVYLSSGGTTGTPKIIMQSNFALNYLCAKAPEFLSRPVGEYGTMFSVLPIFHGFGLCMNMHMCMTLKLKNVMCIKFSARSMARAIPRERVDIVTGVPTMYVKLMAEKAFRAADLSSLKDAFVGGDVVTAQLLSDFTAAMRRGGSGGALYVGYGLTETVTVCAVNTAARNRAGSVGYPLSGTEIRVLREGREVPPGETGEIFIRTPQLMIGYLNGENPWREIDGERWLATGDEGYLDEEGYLFFRQRIKNIIKVSGIPVYPSEIEDALAAVPGVARLCAVAQPDDVRGHVVKLFVEPAPGWEREDIEKRVLAEARRSLIAYAVPRRIVFLDAMPVSLIGKVDRKKLEE